MARELTRDEAAAQVNAWEKRPLSTGPVILEKAQLTRMDTITSWDAGQMT
jgi:hypothetical protein